MLFLGGDGDLAFLPFFLSFAAESLPFRAGDSDDVVLGLTNAFFFSFLPSLAFHNFLAGDAESDDVLGLTNSFLLFSFPFLSCLPSSLCFPRGGDLDLLALRPAFLRAGDLEALVEGRPLLPAILRLG